MVTLKLRKQKGAALLVSMIILIVLTLYGLSVANKSVMQVNMTMMNNDSQVALSAAETAIMEGIAAIEALEQKPDMSMQFGLPGRGDFYGNTDIAPSLTDDTTWDDSGFKTRYLTSDTGINAKYFIVFHGKFGLDSKLIQPRTAQYGDRFMEKYSTDPKGEPYLFRIVALGVGHSKATKRIVEVFYSRNFPAVQGEGS